MEKIKALRAELNEALYAMIDATSDKRYHAAESRVWSLRRALVSAMHDYWYDEPRYCDYCGESLEAWEVDLCAYCQPVEEAA